jgi:hypothetical protein
LQTVVSRQEVVFLVVQYWTSCLKCGITCFREKYEIDDWRLAEKNKYEQRADASLAGGWLSWQRALKTGNKVMRKQRQEMKEWKQRNQPDTASLVS